MRIPEPLFPFINAVVRATLQSPLHGALSDSILLLRVRGRKTGRPISVPLRYIKEQDTVRCSTSKAIQWWKNVRANPDIVLRIKGREEPYRARVITDDPDVIRSYLLRLIENYPQDAIYHEIDLDGSTPNEAQLEAALASAVVVEAQRE